MTTRAAARASRGAASWVADALRQPAGAGLVRCALLVNPFAYLVAHKKTTGLASEDDYNAEIVARCVELGIGAIAVTDHSRADTAVRLLEGGREAFELRRLKYGF